MQGERVQCLIFVGAAAGFGKQAAEAFAGRRQEKDIGILVLRRCMNVGGSRLFLSGRFVAIECDVFLAREEVEQSARHTGEPIEIADSCSITVDPAKASEFRL